MLASCSNDDLVINTTVDETADTPIGFAVSTGNMTRAEQLSTEHWDFGVFAYKGTSDPVGKVMVNYMVGFWDIANNRGYKPTNNQDLKGTNASSYVWYYETLGKDQQSSWSDTEGNSGSAGFEFLDGGTDKVKSTSRVSYQYLKYWDRTTGMNTWFYAYAPYSLNYESGGMTYNNSKHQLKFPTISSISDNGKGAMYAGKKVANPNGTDNKFVDLEFKRLLAQVRLAFYEVVPGYKVELVDYSSKVTIPSTDKWAGFGTKAMYAVPANKETDGTYSSGTYLTSAKPVVTFDNEMAATISYDDESATNTNTNINIPLWFYSGDTQTNVLGTTRESAIMNQTKDVIPSGDTYCGFTINLSLKFTALDTNEEVWVMGVRVHIPKEHCQWKSNTRYTYYFKVTQSVPGSSSEPGTPSVTPSTDAYLLPIVFDKVTVDDMATWDNESSPYAIN